MAGAGTGLTLSIGVGEGSAPVFALVAGGSAEGSSGGPVGALVGVIGAVGTYDVIEGHKLCEAYGWCSTPQPEPAPAPFRAPLVLPSPDVMQQLQPLPLPGVTPLAGRYTGGGGKWSCTATCNVQGIGNNPGVSRVTGTGSGNNENEACRNAKRFCYAISPSWNVCTSLLVRL